MDADCCCTGPHGVTERFFLSLATPRASHKKVKDMSARK
jgi:hypothetical protein